MATAHTQVLVYNYGGFAANLYLHDPFMAHSQPPPGMEWGWLYREPMILTKVNVIAKQIYHTIS